MQIINFEIIFQAKFTVNLYLIPLLEFYQNCMSNVSFSDKKKLKMQVRSGVKLTAVAVLFVALIGHNLQPVEGQFFNALANLFRPLTRVFRPRFHDDGTQRPGATGRDEILPSDCGRDPDKGTGKLCFPDGLLCQQRKFLFFIFEKC